MSKINRLAKTLYWFDEIQQMIANGTQFSWPTEKAKKVTAIEIVAANPDTYQPSGYDVNTWASWHAGATEEDNIKCFPVKTDKEGKEYCIYIVGENIHPYYDLQGANGESAKQMFYSFTNLITIKNLKHIDFSSCISFSYMFAGCSVLNLLDVSNMDVSNGQNFSYMFYGTNTLDYLNLSTWKNSKATDVSFMFAQMHQIRTLDIRGFNTEHVTNFVSMFEQCQHLTDIYGLENLDTSNGRQFFQMFCECGRIKELNLSSFNTQAAFGLEKWIQEHADAGYDSAFQGGLAQIFMAVHNLEKITFGPNFVYAKNHCDKLALDNNKSQCKYFLPIPLDGYYETPGYCGLGDPSRNVGDGYFSYVKGAYDKDYDNIKFDNARGVYYDISGRAYNIDEIRELLSKPRTKAITFYVIPQNTATNSVKGFNTSEGFKRYDYNALDNLPAIVNGRDGAPGKDGKDGYTPIRGVDYWTPEDKEEIKQYLEELVLGGAW